MKAVIKVIRDNYTKNSTQGKLYLNNEYICETLEDVCRDINKDGDLDDNGEGKIYGQTAIPAGTYKMSIIMSPHFKTYLFLLHNVKGFTSIEIHPGNWISDTLGCILVGLERGIDMIKVGTSKKAFDFLMSKVIKGKQPLFTEYSITIIDKK